MKISPPGHLKVKSELQKLHSDALKNTVFFRDRDLSRLQTIRASQLPFCPLEFVLATGMGGKRQPYSFYTAFFTSVGTTVHEVFQQFHGKSAQFVADWECPVCKNWKRLSHDNVCCGVDSIHHELIIKHKWVVGHVDNVFRDENGDYWVVDYKTTSTARVSTVVQSPPQEYREQVEAYAFALKEQYGLNIKGIILIFIVRDNPTVPHIWAEELTPKQHEITGRRLQRYSELHKVAYSASSLDDLKALWKARMCKPHEVDEKAPGCLFRRGCQDGDPTEAKAWFKRGIANKYIPIKPMVERELAKSKSSK